jgi:uncharacterized protein
MITTSPRHLQHSVRHVPQFRIDPHRNPTWTAVYSEMDGRALRNGRNYIALMRSPKNGFPILPRVAAEQVRTALDDTPVVMVIGPRQCGKTTLVRELVGGSRSYLTLDDDTVLAAARHDPMGFVRELDVAVIDEVQRAPDLLRAIKLSVDDDRRPGRFLLTGSANVLSLPQLSESLAGRMATIELFPLSQPEMLRLTPSFLSRALEGKLVEPGTEKIGADLVRAVLMGGYPEMVRREDANRRRAWARDYATAIARRDVGDIADVAKQERLGLLFRVLAHHATQLTNFSQVAGRVGIDDKTAKRYVALLEQLFILRRVEPWSGNRVKRLVKTPKLHFVDSGLLAAVLGVTLERIAEDRSALGPLLETFVFAEVLKQAGWLDEPYSLLHYRDKDQDEVDLVLEAGAGTLVGIEVKAAATVGAGDFRGLRKLAEACGDRLKLGLVLYDGNRVVPFGERMFAAPVSCLWGS